MAGSGGFEPPKIGFAGQRPILSRRRTQCLCLKRIKKHLNFLAGRNKKTKLPVALQQLNCKPFIQADVTHSHGYADVSDIVIKGQQ